jgi:integrase
MDPGHCLAESLGMIISYGLWAKRKGCRPSTVEASVRALKSIARHTDLRDHEHVREYLANANCSESRKERLVIDLLRFYGFKGVRFEPPRYRRVQRLPFIPQESEVDQLIAGMGKKTACFLQLLKETGIRPGEAWQLQWTDVDFERAAVNILPEKDSNPRLLKVSHKLLGMLNTLPTQYDHIFRNPKIDLLRSMDRFRSNYFRRRRNLAERLSNPRIGKISFKTLRHFKATMFYRSTKDILATMQLLGHKNIRNTLVYTHLVQFESDEYVCKAARTIEEATSFVEDGFEYATDMEGCKLFRKRK